MSNSWKMKKNQAKKREAGREVPAEGAIVLSRLSVAQVNEIKNKVIQRSKLFLMTGTKKIIASTSISR